MTSALERFDGLQRWSAQLNSVQGAASKLDSVTDRIGRIQAPLTSEVADASAVYDSIPDASKMIFDSMPSVTGIATEPVPSWMKGAQGDFIYRWTAKGHHVAFSRTENEEAYCSLLKALAIIARARRNSL
jgi:hypothetical protein